jgi:hypothetical protein
LRSISSSPPQKIYDSISGSSSRIPHLHGNNSSAGGHSFFERIPTIEFEIIIQKIRPYLKVKKFI